MSYYFTVGYLSFYWFKCIPVLNYKKKSTALRLSGLGPWLATVRPAQGGHMTLGNMSNMSEQSQMATVTGQFF